MSNTGNWNTGDRNTGYFNTKTPEEILVFNKPIKREEWDTCDKPDFIYFNFKEWVLSQDMSQEEKEANPSYKTTGGYLKEYDYKEAR